MLIELNTDEKYARERIYMANKLAALAPQIVTSVDIVMEAMETLEAIALLAVGEGDAPDEVMADAGFDPTRIKEALREARDWRGVADSTLVEGLTIPGTALVARAAVEIGSALAGVSKTLNAMNFQLVEGIELVIDFSGDDSTPPQTCLSGSKTTLSVPEDILGLAADIVAGATALTAIALEGSEQDGESPVFSEWDPVVPACISAAELVIAAARSIQGHGGGYDQLSVAHAVNSVTRNLGTLSKSTVALEAFLRCVQATAVSMEVARDIALQPNKKVSAQETLNVVANLAATARLLAAGCEEWVAEGKEFVLHPDLDDLVARIILAAGPISDLAKSIVDSMEFGTDDPDGVAANALGSLTDTLEAIALLVSTIEKLEVLAALAALMPRACAVVRDAAHRAVQSAVESEEELARERRSIRSACAMAKILSNMSQRKYSAVVLRKVMAAAVQVVVDVSARLDNLGTFHRLHDMTDSPFPESTSIH